MEGWKFVVSSLCFPLFSHMQSGMDVTFCQMHRRLNGLFISTFLTLVTLLITLCYATPYGNLWLNVLIVAHFLVDVSNEITAEVPSKEPAGEAGSLLLDCIILWVISFRLLVTVKTVFCFFAKLEFRAAKARWCFRTASKINKEILMALSKWGILCKSCGLFFYQSLLCCSGFESWGGWFWLNS